LNLIVTGATPACKNPAETIGKQKKKNKPRWGQPAGSTKKPNEMNNEITTTQTGAVVNSQPKKGLRGLLEGEQFKNAIAAALPKHLPAERFIRVAITAMTRTPKLADCDQASFFNSLLTLSQCGIEPDGRRAYLIPYENRKRGVTECQLIISYMGLLELAMRTGEISNVHADKICDNDIFEYDRGQIGRHQIDFRRPRGSAYAYYAICRFKDGTEKAEVMTLEEVEAIRNRSRAGNSGPWVTDFDEMAKKTAFRRLSKWLPLSSEYRDALDKDADQLPSIQATIEKPAAVKPVFTRPPRQTPVLEQTLELATEIEIPEEPAPAPKPRASKEVVEESFAEIETDTPQKQLAIALRDALVPEGGFMSALKNKLPGAKKASTISELSDELASQALNKFNSIIEEIE
jgi:recombination protein RecT